MKRALLVCLLVSTVVLLAGCPKKPPQAGPTQAALPPEPMEIRTGPPEGIQLPPPPGDGDTVVLPPPPPPLPPRTHVVVKGENLYRIAMKYYGSGSKANRDRIMAANPQIADENQIKEGQKLVIPD